MSSEAYVIIKQNEYMKKFRKAGATDAGPGRSPKWGSSPSRIFRKMEDKAIFLPGRTPETYYMDPNAAEEFIEARRRRAVLHVVARHRRGGVVFFLGRR